MTANYARIRTTLRARSRAHVSEDRRAKSANRTLAHQQPALWELAIAHGAKAVSPHLTFTSADKLMLYGEMTPCAVLSMPFPCMPPLYHRSTSARAGAGVGGCLPAHASSLAALCQICPSPTQRDLSLPLNDCPDLGPRPSARCAMYHPRTAALVSCHGEAYTFRRRHLPTSRRRRLPRRRRRPRRPRRPRHHSPSSHENVLAVRARFMRAGPVGAPSSLAEASRDDSTGRVQQRCLHRPLRKC